MQINDRWKMIIQECTNNAQIIQSGHESGRNIAVTNVKNTKIMEKTKMTRSIEFMSEDSTQKLNTWLRGHRLQMLQCIPALVIFLLAVYRLSEIGQPILFNDEVGYWSNSAFFMGMDWTSVTGQISYYSYGYSLLLIPIRILADWFSWRWDALYHAAVMMNAGFLVMSYVIALKLVKRYLPDMNDLIRTMACFTVFTYSSYIVYAHITWTECTLTFFFWIFLYVMMRVVDCPGIMNHIALGAVPFYIYTVHQRALGIIVASVIIVLYLRIFRRNQLRDTAAFFGSMYLYSLVHAMIKGHLQNVNYMGGEPAGAGEILGYAFTVKSLLLLVAGVGMLLLLWLIERGRRKTAAGFLAAGIILCAGYFILRNGGQFQTAAAAGVDHRISVNDFSGQWGVVKNIFSINGLIRLGISITGKWFYMASVSGLVACWGIWALFKNAWLLLGDSLRKWKQHRGIVKSGGARKKNAEKCALENTDKSNTGDEADKCDTEAADYDGSSGVQTDTGEESRKNDDIWKERIWLFGVFLAWFGTFMISAIYKEGLYKNDDLFNGRYVEFTVGFVLIYGLHSLINDKSWVRTTVFYMILYIAAGKLCQYAVDELQRKEFELAHCVMFGRVFWNYEVPYGKVAELTRYVAPLTIGFLILLKAARDRLSKAVVVRTILALMIPVMAWSYLGKTIVDAYVVVRNEKQAEPLVQFADWIKLLGREEKIYYILDSANSRYAGALQYLLQDRPVTAVGLGEVPFSEDAFYVVKRECLSAEQITENCEALLESRGYVLMVNKDQGLMENWKRFHE